MGCHSFFVGICTAKHFRQTADRQIEATSPITFQVFLRGVTVTGESFPIVLNSKTFISIRNVPYTELNVVDVKSEPRRTFAPASKNMLVPDPAQPALPWRAGRCGESALPDARTDSAFR